MRALLPFGSRPRGRRHHTRRRAVAALALLGVVVLLSACSAEGQEPPTPVAAFRYDQARWRLPLDHHVVSPIAADHAQSVAYSRCMQRHGVRVPVVDPADYLGASTNANLRHLFTLALAQHWGYHAAPSRTSPTTNRSAPLTGAAVAWSTRCGTAATKMLAVDSPALAQVGALAGAAYDRAKHDPQLARLDADWRRCVARRTGVTDLPRTPLEMPSPSQERLFGWTGRGDSAAAPPLRSIEVRQATDDAACQQQTGTQQRLYEVEVQQQLGLMARFPGLLGRADADRQAADQRIARVLARGTS